MQNNKAAVSAMLGGLINLFPGVIFARKTFKYHGARSARKIANNFYKGEAIKIILSVILFATVFKVFEIMPVAFFLTYIVVQCSYWLAPWLIINNTQYRPKSD